MLAGLAARLPISVKINGVVKALGISKEEVASVDSVIHDFTKGPVISTVLGRSFGNLSDLVEFVMSVNTDATTDAMASKVAAALQFPPIRMSLASYFVKFIQTQPNAAMLMSVLQKVSEAPIPGFGDVDYASPEEFVAEGILPLVMEKFSAQDEHTTNMLVRCPHCTGIFIPS